MVARSPEITLPSSDSLRVVQVLPDLESGGVERGTLELNRYLVRHGHRSTVISNGGRLVAQLEADGGNHLQWPVGEKSYHCLLCVRRFHRFFMRHQVDILHLRSRLPAWIAHLALKSVPVQQRPCVVSTFHGFYSINRYSAIMTKGQRIIAISKAVAVHMQSAYSVEPERIAQIPRGYDETTFDPESLDPGQLSELRHRFGIEGDNRPVIILPARISRWKGHDIFIRSLKLIKDLDWVALIVGNRDENPEYAAELENLITECKLNNRIRMVGHCDRMPVALMLADVVVSAASTQAEAFGRVAVEAQAMGKPVVATAHGGSLETIKAGQTGWLVEPNNHQAMAAALRTALSDHGRLLEMGRNGRRWVKRDFTVRRMCRQTVDVYHRVLAESRQTTGGKNT